ncbi:hypothetical protein OHA77_20025 [Streptosporangium sp. NBC_01639]|uniref:hypothetical protein n=1 Tax=Streptosporangium sp. NBC_01639 TaxID=2975948 RepID=UPI003864D793|nr:hypothetical protein OHA77_20025 [Streptosporangium sp. NBC_01639]
MMFLVLVGFGVVFGMSALFDLPWLVDVLGGRLPLAIGLLFVVVVLGLVAFVVSSVRKIGKRQRRSAE